MTTHREEVASILAGEKLVNDRLARSIELLKGFVPKWGFVLVRIDKATESAGGIVLPEHTKERPVIGTVVAVGPDAKQVSVGERVLFGKYAGVEVEMPDGERLTDHRVLRDVECYGGWGVK